MSLQSKVIHLKELTSDRDKLVDTLRMWGDVEAQGIDPEDVDRFALRSEFMDHTQQRDMRLYRYAKGGKPIDGVCRPTHANCLIMKSGEVVRLNPWIQLP